MPYCSGICAQAHIFEHECEEAPKPWLAPPRGPAAKPPKELGEEGLFGVIPWHMVKYIVMMGLSWGCVWVYRNFDDFRWKHKYSVAEGLVRLVALFWLYVRQGIERRVHFVASLVSGQALALPPQHTQRAGGMASDVAGAEFLDRNGVCEGDSCAREM